MKVNRWSALVGVGGILAFSLADPAALLPQSSQEVVVTSAAANVRSGPSTNNPPVLLAERGTRFIVVRQVGAWYEVELPISVGVSASRGFIHQSTVVIDSVVRIGPEDPGPSDPDPSGGDPTPPIDEDYGPSSEVDAVELQRRWTDRQWREYERYKKSEFAAAGLEWIVPMLGYAYVDKAAAGMTPALVSLGGLTTSFIGAYAGDTGSAPLVFGGLAAYVGGRIWGIVNALEYADSYNRELIRRVSTVTEGSSIFVEASGEGAVIVGLRVGN